MLTTGAVALIIGRDRVTVWRWARARQIPMRRVGGRLLITHARFHAWLGSGEAIKKTLQNVAR